MGNDKKALELEYSVAFSDRGERRILNEEVHGMRNAATTPPR